jgi:aldehyde dehydrogenase (NAD+)
MQQLEHLWINGEFTRPQGEDYFDLYNPSTAEVTGRIRMANADDAARAIAAAKAAFVHWSHTSVEERLAVLQRMRDAMAACQDELLHAIIRSTVPRRHVPRGWPVIRWR